MIVVWLFLRDVKSFFFKSPSVFPALGGVGYLAALLDLSSPKGRECGLGDPVPLYGGSHSKGNLEWNKP